METPSRAELLPDGDDLLAPDIFAGETNYDFPHLDSESPEIEPDSDADVVPLGELSSAALHVLLRENLSWCLGGALLILVGFLLPAPHWALGWIRSLMMLGGIFVGLPRLWMLNGVLAEFRLRQESIAGDSSRD